MIVTQDAQVVSSGDDAIRQKKGTAQIVVDGDLYGANDGLDLRGTSTVTIGAEATVFGVNNGLRATKNITVTNYGILDGGTGLRSTKVLTLDNYGSIDGILALAGANIVNGIGGALLGTTTISGTSSATIDLSNDGQMGSGGVALSITATGGEVNLSNSGLIQGDVEMSVTDGFVRFTNTGIIDGTVELGSKADRFDARGGHVTGEIQGKGGNDTYIIDDATVEIVEANNGGNDRIVSSVSFSLELAANVETLKLTGGESLRGTGDASDNTVIGNSGGNRISGLDGDDSLIGGSGGDSLRGGRGNDLLEGGTEEDLLVGAAGSDSLFGGSGDDTLLGGGLHDVLTGGDGNDAVNGGFGNDTIIASRGLDDMTGSFGNDTFRFEDPSIWEATADDDDVARPIIADFKSGADAIDLRGIDADGTGSDTAFTFIGTNVSFSNRAGELRADTTQTSNRTILEGDLDGDGAYDIRIEMLGTFNLVNSDFFL